LADFTAIYSVGNSLASYLQNNYPPALNTSFPATFQLVASAQIAEEDQTNLDKVVSIFLHRITFNEHLRSATRLQDSSNKQPALFLDLHYLITYWGTDPRAEQTILAWTMLQLQSAPILDNSILSPSTTWDANENVQIVPADLSLEDILRIWDALGPKYRLSLSYIARVIRIDRGLTPTPPVIATRFTVEEQVAQ
jgi:Pvc16 N-terminal domain